MRRLIKESVVPGIGKVKYFENSRAKAFSIKVNINGEITVSVPKKGKLKDAVKFVDEKSEWIKKTLLKMKSKSDSQFVWDEKTKFKTKYCDVKIIPSDVQYVLIHLDENLLEIQYPQEKDVASPEIQAGIKFGITETLRLEAKDYLPGRVKYLADKFGFKYNRIFIKHQKSKWGSYSSRGNINLNLELMLLPDELIDFIILHELAHSKYLNHGKEFHRLLNKITGGREKELDAEINKHRFMLH